MVCFHEVVLELENVVRATTDGVSTDDSTRKVVSATGEDVADTGKAVPGIGLSGTRCPGLSIIS